ncbi:ExeM/NucH family extracellular endonuclease [Planctobacterium marinum]|uniref:ExeM/NucH family extracellular endonuclease n=1 Tax=Planctobacterium marinum TaxID=1631968 RepID=UPI001E366AB7|nr:ExeM/NucH family extracellular endonuclease [Planctobacterium marinum]MCC2607162.1 ExeM/NucH family extracellular endonuclease [Planctobacterium marinum]
MLTKLSVISAAVMAATTALADDIYISEYIEGSSYNKAIELHNPTGAAIDLSAYSLDFYFNGNTSVGYSIALEGSLASDAAYVVAHGSAAQAILDKANQLKSGSWFNGDDAVVLSKEGVVVDAIGQVGVDPGSSWDSNGASTKDKTLRRISGIVSGDSDAFDAFYPDVEWQVFDKDSFDDLGSHGGSDGGSDGDNGDNNVDLGLCSEAATLISAVQGTAAESPLKGTSMVVEAIVVADLQQNNQLNGYFIQEEDSDTDNDTASSEGVFVYDSTTEVNVGDKVRLVAEVQEYYGATQLGNVAAAEVCGTGFSVTAASISLPVANNEALESVEGMLVNIPQTLTVADNYSLSRYGEIVVSSGRLYNPTQIALPGDAANAVAAANALNQITIDDGSTQQNPDAVPYPAPELSAANTLRAGTEIQGVTGVVTYGFSKYRIHPTQSLNFVDANPRTVAPEYSYEGELRVASYNVLNYFNGDGQGAGFPTSRGADSMEEFVRQRDKTIAAILTMDAHIVGLLEVENDGFGEFSAIQDLVNGLNDNATEGEWDFVNFNADNIGTDQITSAIIYRKDMVAEVGTAAHTTAVPFDYGNRAPVAQTFKDLSNNDELTFVVTHLRSKGSCSSAEGDDQDLGDGQGCWNATRVLAANELMSWLTTNPTGIAESDIMILGDMNAYGMEDPITTFKSHGLTDLKAAYLGSYNYSYIYQGESGSLDHAFASASLSNKIKSVTDWHINADEPIALDYNTEYKSAYQQANLYAPDAYRASDHDPVIIEIDTYQESELEWADLSGKRGWRTYQFELPEDAKYLEVTTSGGQGELSLWLNHDKRPNKRRYQCRSDDQGTAQRCVIESPESGKWYIRLRGEKRYSGVSMKVYSHN